MKFMLMSVNEIGICGQCLKKPAKFHVKMTGHFWLRRRERHLCLECAEKWKKHYEYDVE